MTQKQRKEAASMHIAGRRIGPNDPPFVIAEMSANHLGSLERAFAIVDAAAAMGAHALKLQTYTADTLTIESDRDEFQINDGPWAGQSLHALYQSAYTPWEWHEAIFERAKSLGMSAFSSPFDASAVDFLESLDVPAYKIASFELVDHGLIARCAATKKPLIMSTGLAAPEEILEAVEVARDHGAEEICVLHCLSGYPTPPSEFNLRRLAELRELTGTLVGISDHSPGATIPVAASALGACVIEKHLTLARADGGPDAAFSLEPEELRQVVEGSRVAWEALGSGAAARAKSESANKRYRRSLYVVKDIAAGERFREEHLRSIRPNLGLAPKHLAAVVGEPAACDIEAGTPLSWEHVAGKGAQTPKTAIVIQARMGSSRLPGKVLKDVAGKSLLAHLVDRLKTRPCGQLVVATTTSPSDDKIVAECERLGVLCVRGSEDDVLSRYLDAARCVDAEVVVRITADCPLMDPAMVEAMVSAFHEEDLDYLSNSLGDGLPRGQNVEVMTRAALERAGREATEPYQREHVTPYLYECEGRYRKANLTWPERLAKTWPDDLAHHRWTVDTAEDFELAKRLLEALDARGAGTGMQEILDLLAEHPEWAAINAQIEQKSYREVG